MGRERSTLVVPDPSVDVLRSICCDDLLLSYYLASYRLVVRKRYEFGHDRPSVSRWKVSGVRVFLACHSSTGHIQHVAFNFRALQRFGGVIVQVKLRARWIPMVMAVSCLMC